MTYAASTVLTRAAIGKNVFIVATEYKARIITGEKKNNSLCFSSSSRTLPQKSEASRY